MGRPGRRSRPLLGIATTLKWQTPLLFQGPAFAAGNLGEALSFDAEAGELLVELGDLAAGIHHALHAGPGRVRLRIDVQAQRVAGLAHARPCLELGSVGQGDGGLVIFWVNARLHAAGSCGRRRSRPAAQAAPYSETGAVLQWS